MFKRKMVHVFLLFLQNIPRCSSHFLSFIIHKHFSILTTAAKEGGGGTLNRTAAAAEAMSVAVSQPRWSNGFCQKAEEELGSRNASCSN